MIDSKTSAPARLVHGNCEERAKGSASAMDNSDWYYRWLLFSHFQHQQGWQQKLLSPPQDMTLVSPECICGFCETIGANVKHNPNTVARILQALNMKQPPTTLEKPELNERIGLCSKCECQIKLLEEAASIRENLTESLLSNLKHLSTPADTRSLNGFSTNSTHQVPFAQTMQKKNEVTPQQHSIRRKISAISNWSSADSIARIQQKQLKRSMMEKTPEQVNGGLAVPSNNSSDEENELKTNELSLSASVSPRSSYGGPTPPPISPTVPSHQPSQQVLSDVTCGRKRRKQARPSKAAGDVLSTAVEHHVSPQPTPPPAAPVQSISPAPQYPISPSPHSSSSRPSSATSRPPPVSTADSQAAKRTKLSPAPSLTQAQLLAAQSFASSFPAAILPFNYSSFYQSNDLFSAHQPSSAASTPSAVLLAQSIYRAAASNNQLALARTLQSPGVPSLYPNGPHIKTPQRKADTLIAAKKEPKVPAFNFTSTMPPVSIQPGTSDNPASPKAHKLIKTDKRRYCKVCAASMRKANNGRPPQSRFLCEPCKMPMCRSCIEEHRYRVMLKGDPDKKGEVKPSASAKLLQAVKMKDKAAVDGKLSPVVTKSVSSSILSAPPSHSSIIYGAPSPNTLPSAVNGAHVKVEDAHSTPVSLHLSTSPLDMRLPAYKPLAPALPKDNSPSADEADSEHTASADSGDEADKLVIEEMGDDSGMSCNSSTAEQTDITAEMANSTVAMLMPMEDESASSAIATEQDAGKVDQSLESISQPSSDGGSQLNIPTEERLVDMA